MSFLLRGATALPKLYKELPMAGKMLTAGLGNIGLMGGGSEAAQHLGYGGGWHPSSVPSDFAEGVIAGPVLGGALRVAKPFFFSTPAAEVGQEAATNLGRLAKLKAAGKGKGGKVAAGALGVGSAGILLNGHFGEDKKPTSKKIAAPVFNPVLTGGTMGPTMGSAMSLESLLAGGGQVNVADQMPSYFEYMNSPGVKSMVAQDINAMQRPYISQIANRKQLGAAQAKAIADVQHEFARTSGGLRKEVHQSNKDYSSAASTHAGEAEDAMTALADRLMGSSIVSPHTSEEIAQKTLESAGRRSADEQRAIEAGLQGGSATGDLMSEMAQVEELRNAQDLKDAAEQGRLDIGQLNQQMTDVAAQAPTLRNQYGGQLANYELSRYKMLQDQQNAQLKAYTDLQKEAAKGAGGDFSKWFTQLQKQEHPVYSTRTSDPDTNKSKNVSTYLSQSLSPEEMATLQSYYTQGGPEVANQYYAFLHDQLLNAGK